MSFLRYGIGANYGRFYNKLKDIAEQENRSVASLLAAFADSFLRYSCGLSDFLNYRLWERTRAQRREYVTIGGCDRLYAQVSPEEYKTFFTVKPNFLRNFSEYIHRDFFDPGRGSAEELEAFLKANPVFMEKPVDGLAGRDVRRRSAGEIISAGEYYRQLCDKRLFVEGYLTQHPDMAEMAPSSVNTLRVMTVCYDGKSELLYACCRVGSGTADVDNFHAGGMGVALDMDTGRLRGEGINKDGRRFAVHPVTGVRFDGRQIPFWQEAKKACLNAATVNPNIHVVGWDVAITPDGPAFIEGNRRPGFDLVQMIEGRGRKDIVRHIYACRDKAGK